jgi:phospholipid/cholesterol/gamma-HCH transport system ATP-binding protein
MSALIELKSVTNRFGEETVHDSVNLAIMENETLGLVGGSGSGKSVLLRTMIGLNAPQDGEVLADGTDLYKLSPEERLNIQRRWGVLFQNGALFSGLSVLDNIALPLREHTDLSRGTIEDLSFTKLQMVGLDADAAEKRPSELSGGMITRAGVARAMALDPDILFLDEPTGALDPTAASSLDQLMRSLHEVLNLSILIITHDPNTLVTVCDRIAMIVDKKLESGTLDEMLASENEKIRSYFSDERVKAALAKRQ